MPARTFHLAAEDDGHSLPQVLRRLCHEKSWSQVRSLIGGRFVQVNGNLCLDEGRRLKEGDVLKLWDHPLAKPPEASDIKIVYLDEHLVVVSKPAGLTTLRHRAETDLPERRRQLQPTLDELLPQVLSAYLGVRIKTADSHDRGESAAPIKRRQRGWVRAPAKPPLDTRLITYPVHRLDRDTSGLMVFARTQAAEEKLIQLFAKHDVERAYVAVAHGRVPAQTIDTWLVRDRVDGLRGSVSVAGTAPIPAGAQRAITHLQPIEVFTAAASPETEYSIVDCRLETGRTHQIRIHLAEIGHMLCGEKVYTHAPGQPPRADDSRSPRHALHAAVLGFKHPITGAPLRLQQPLPKDLKEWLVRLRSGNVKTKRQ
ncbi:MAG: RluA family pseudouridine synthase [Pirellulaceae bacterium]|nr:RluA family pseudouridine synthase [Pirellulaceae bacterium]